MRASFGSPGGALEDLAVFDDLYPPSGDDAADLAAPAGVLDLADINAFVGSFTGGCPRF